jgi:hypothetical protein
MNIGDYIKEKLSMWSVELSDDYIDSELNRVGLWSSAAVSSEINLDTFFYNVIPDIIMIPSNISEGGFSIARNKDAIIAFYDLTCKRLGQPNLLNKDTITDITSKW